MAMTRSFQSTLLAVMACCASLPAIAQTPDDEPPALEDICDMETGAAYGMCNAYCEAMDCELANDGDPLTEPSASETACGKVASKFQQLTGRELPCELVCPCTANPLAFPFWNAVLMGELVPSSCGTWEDLCPLVGLPAERCEPPLGDRLGVLLPSGEFIFVSAFGWDFPEIGLVRPPRCGENSAASAVLEVTPAQGAVCRGQMEEALEAAGLMCGTGPF